QMSDAMRQRIGLAGAGPGDDQQRPGDEFRTAFLAECRGRELLSVQARRRVRTILGRMLRSLGFIYICVHWLKSIDCTARGGVACIKSHYCASVHPSAGRQGGNAIAHAALRREGFRLLASTSLNAHESATLDRRGHGGLLGHSMARDQVSSGRDTRTPAPWLGAHRLRASASVKRRARVANTAPSSVVQAEQHARASGLVYVCDTEPGIRRKRAGSGFRYLGPDGETIRNARTLQRIRSLAIPPAYTDVWICLDERGHLQATGRDARNRKQYRYHPRWRATRDHGKFTRMIEFGSQLPRLRRRLKRDLARSGLPKERVLALIVTLMDETLIRVGNEEYARTNDSYGATTLRDRHAKFLGNGRATLSFRGKGGK